MGARWVFLLWIVLGATVQAQEAPHVVEGAMTVNARQAKILYDHGAMFVDVRSSREWGWGHVDGAVHLDLADRFSALALPHWPREQPLVIYCDSEVCPRSALAVHLAVSWGYQQVFYFRSGYFAWQLLDYPLDKGQASEVLAFTSGGR
ncbi:MAG: rhodanese-like domain-containing protein [Pseudomonas sp.]|uniref:rhodanese-like domain-containing protein n=1 Tax=Pseudomonas sp. TaxID=306 RepID=UPI003D0A613E